MSEQGREHKVRSVGEYGRTYVKQYLAKARARRDAIRSDPLQALEFLHSKLFMRGRRDAVSIAFRDRTAAALRLYGTLEEIDLAGLDDYLHAQSVNNRHDRRMVVESVRFVRAELSAYGGNVYNWAVGAIRDGRIRDAYLALDGIHAVGDKLASFYLRDVVFLEEIEDGVHVTDYPYLQPVDSWVLRVGRSLKLIDGADSGAAAKDKLISSCLTADVSPLLFNAGAWLVGAHAYELLIETLQGPDSRNIAQSARTSLWSKKSPLLPVSCLPWSRHSCFEQRGVSSFAELASCCIR